MLYHDTWRMARERLLFGWGMGSYPVVFALYNSQESKVDRLPVIYHDAHSDWLQSVAELGLAGTALIGAAVALPALAMRRLRVTTVPFFLLAGLRPRGRLRMGRVPLRQRGGGALLVALLLRRGAIHPPHRAARGALNAP